MNNNSDHLHMKSIQSYGIHGAIGLLMGIGAGIILGGYIFNIAISSLTADYSSVLMDSIRNGATGLFIILIIYGIYGYYVGYIFGGPTRSSRMSRTYAASGIFGGLVTSGLLAGEFIRFSGLESLFITLVFAGPILGFPEKRNIILMTGSSSSGAALGYCVYFLGQNITVYLNSIWTQGALLALIVAIIFPIFAIAIAGASIAIGMYFTEETAYTAWNIPWFLKITRGAGIVLTLIALLFFALMFMSMAKYSTNDVSIDISSGEGKITVFVPVLLENGNVMDMYKKPSISGNAATEIIDTEYGKAFKISGSGSIKINMGQTGGFLTKDSLSTSNELRFYPTNAGGNR